MYVYFSHLPPILDFMIVKKRPWKYFTTILYLARIDHSIFMSEHETQNCIVQYSSASSRQYSSDRAVARLKFTKHLFR